MAIASRAELHALIERLPESELHAVQLFLRFVHAQAQSGDRSGIAFIGRRSSDDQYVVVDAGAEDPVALALAIAPEDDEPSTAEEDIATEADWQAYREARAPTASAEVAGRPPSCPT